MIIDRNSLSIYINRFGIPAHQAFTVRALDWSYVQSSPFFHLGRNRDRKYGVFPLERRFSFPLGRIIRLLSLNSVLFEDW